MIIIQNLISRLFKYLASYLMYEMLRYMLVFIVIVVTSYAERTLENELHVFPTSNWQNYTFLQEEYI